MFSPHTLYIRNRIVQWAFRPRIRNDGSRCTDVVLINHSDHDLRWNRCQQGDFRCRLFVSQDKQDENIQEHRKGSSRVYPLRQHIIACWKQRAITARCLFICFQRQALPSALKIR